MSEYIWKTYDGRTLDIRWMDSLHLIRSVNLVIRNNPDKLRQKQAELMMRQADTLRQNSRTFALMLREVKARGALIWEPSTPPTADQIHAGPMRRETFPIMCMVRALLDTGVAWPSDADVQDSVIRVRLTGETFINDFIETVKADPHPDLERLLAKYTEYRLAPPVNGS